MLWDLNMNIYERHAIVKVDMWPLVMMEDVTWGLVRVSHVAEVTIVEITLGKREKIVWATLNNTFNDILKTSTWLYERHTLVKVDIWPMVVMGVKAQQES